MNDPSFLPRHLRNILLWLLIFGLLGLAASRNYLLFHSLAEIFSIVIATGVFMFAWTSRHILPNDYLLFLGIAYLYVGLLDLFHTLAYQGMGVLPGRGANEATQLWIAARYVESLALVAAPLFLKRKLRPALTFAGFTLLCGLILGTIFYWNVFPVCYLKDRGLSLFKIYSEDLICLLLLAAVGLLLVYRRQFEPDVLRLLITSILLTVASELTFTTYVSIYGWANFAGHALKILSFFFIYRAVIQTGLTRPYSLLFRDLKRSQEELSRQKNFAENLRQENCRMDEQRLGRQLPESREPGASAASLPGRARCRSGRALHRPHPMPERRPTGHRMAQPPATDDQGALLGLLCVGHDLTERLQTEQEHEQLIGKLQEALQKIKTLSGLLPICASCKKVRDDHGYWRQIEVYIRDHSEAEFSHGICPDCAQKLYPDLYQNLSN